MHFCKIICIYVVKNPHRGQASIDDLVIFHYTFSPGLKLLLLLKLQFLFFFQLCTSGSPTIGSIDNYSILRWHQTDDVGFVPSAGLQDVFMAVSLDLPDLESQYGA